MGDLIILILIVVGLIIAMRALRKAFAWFDKVLIGLVILVPIILGLTAGIWYAIGALFALLFVVFNWLGLGGGTVVKRGRHQWTLKCSECNYDDLEILNETKNQVTAKCRRCGKIMTYILDS